MDKKNTMLLTVIAVATLLVAVVGLSVAYAALSTSLSISGTATVNSATWQVEFVEGAWDTPVGSAVTSGPEFGVTSLSNIGVTLVKPGDKAVYRFKVHNKGTLPAKLSAGTSVGTISCTGGANQSEADTTCSNIIYTLTYGDGKVPTADDTLAASEQKDLILTVEFKSSAATVPSSAVTVNGISATLEYVQGQ